MVLTQAQSLLALPRLIALAQEAKNFINPSSRAILRMRGLPFQANNEEIVDFFSRGTTGCQVCSDGGVLILRRPDGKSTGEAFVMFESDYDAELAMSKQKSMMGRRYIELFNSSSTEVAQFLTRTLRSLLPDTKKLQEEFLKETATQTLFNVQDCLRLRGFPITVEVRDVLSFLGVNCDKVVSHGIHLIYTQMGDPTGEALVRMATQADALEAFNLLRDKSWHTTSDQTFLIDVTLCNTYGLHVFTGRVRSPRDLFLEAHQLSLLQNTTLIPSSGMQFQGNVNWDASDHLGLTYPVDVNLLHKILLQSTGQTEIYQNIIKAPQLDQFCDFSKKRTFHQAFQPSDFQAKKNFHLDSPN